MTVVRKFSSRGANFLETQFHRVAIINSLPEWEDVLSGLCEIHLFFTILFGNKRDLGKKKKKEICKYVGGQAQNLKLSW